MRAKYLGAVVALIAAVVTAVIVINRRDPAGPDAGVPIALAEERAARVSALHYDVDFAVPATREEPVRGKLTASFALPDGLRSLAFDFSAPGDHLHSVTANGQSLTPRIQNGHIVIPAGRLHAGTNEVVFEFTSSDAPLNRNDEFMYTLFVPARASLAMPCFDQPDLKARWQLSLEVPPGWTAVSNAAETGRLNASGKTGLMFEDTQPLPTYLFAFAAGKFTVETAQRGGRTYRMFHRETDPARVARNRDQIFDLQARALTWLEQYTGVPYAFGKFDFVLIPSFQFGGMEHAGSIFYNANGLFLDEAATQNQLLARANLISHETAHMWFGDLVTMRWFNDVWMKEVLANFMAAKIANPSFPNVNHDLRFLYQNYPAAYDVDRTEGANPIRQDLVNLNNAGTLYGAIIYQKAPIVMRQLERLMGETAFRDGLREYLKAHALANATWPDLVSVLDVRTPEDLETWSHVWVEERGRPVIGTVLDITNGKIERLAFTDADAHGRGFVWPEKLQVVVGWPASTKTFDVTLSGPLTAVPDAAGLPSPSWVLPVGGGLGYGFFELDPVSREYVTTSLHKIHDPTTRGAALVAMWESMLEGKIPANRVVRELMAALPFETNELTVQQMLEYLRTAFWRYTAADDRQTIVQPVEELLREGLTDAKTTSEKAAWFGALRSMALTPDTVAWLEQVWSHEVTIDRLPLGETDEAELALELAVRDAPEAQQTLDTQLVRFKNPDRKARFAFIMPAVSSDPAVRDKFFASLKEVGNRAHEAWVLDAMRCLNHPLRASTSKKYILPALDLVREIQRTGDIFFPKRWADAALSGYQSVQTAAEVRSFIDHLPVDYPPRLRWVLLSSADPLFRAGRLLTQ